MVRIQNLVIFLTMSLGLISCQSLLTQDDIQKQQTSVENGNQAALEKLYENRYQVPDQLKDDYVKAIGSAHSDTSSVMLRELFSNRRYANNRQAIIDQLAETDSETNAEFIRSKIKFEPELASNTVQNFLIKRADRPSAESLFQLIQQKYANLTEPVIQMFGEVGYTEALPLLISTADSGQNIEVAVDAISRFNTKPAGNYLLATAKSTDHPARIEAIRHLSVVEDQEESRQLLDSLLDVDDSKVILAALESLAMMGLQEESYNKVEHLYQNSSDKEVQDAALQTMATMRKIEQDQIVAELTESSQTTKRDTNITQTDNNQNKKNLIQTYKDTTKLTDIISKSNKQKSTSVEKLPIKKRSLYQLDESEAAAKRYSQQIKRSTDRLFGKEAEVFRNQVNSSLISYSKSNSENAKFIQRSYERGFGVDQANAKNLLQKGLSLSNSLHSILSAITYEYKRTDLQIYALSTFLQIKRKQAEQLLNAYRSKQL